jgi:O-antigen ligase/cytochrome c-type biogenesis protein CcmH/NrfG
VKKSADAKSAQSRRRAPVATAWREAAMGLSCAMVAIFVLAMDASLLNVFDLAKAGYTHALAWLLLGVLLMVAAADGLRIARSPLFLAFYALIAVEILTTATATNRYVALYGEVGRYLGLTTHLVLALMAIAIAVGMDYPRRASWLALTLGAASLVSAGYAGLQAMGADPIKWVDRDSKLRPFGTFGNPDFYGQFLATVIVAGAAIALFAGQGPRWVRWAAAGLAVVSAGLLILTLTRGGVIGVVAGAIVLGVVWLRRTGATRSALTRLGLGTLGLAAALLTVVLTTQLGDRLVAATNIENVQDRVLIYTAGTRIFLDNPVLGVGFENFAVAYPKYAEAAGINRNRTQTSAHNWIIHLAATTGLVGLAATAAFLAAFSVHVWKRARDDDALPLLAAAGALAAFYGSGLVLPGAQSIQWIPWACFGVALASDLRTAPAFARLPPVRLPMLARVAILGGLALVAFIQAAPLDANRLIKTAESTLRVETAQTSVDAARAALAADSGRAVYWNDLGRALELVDDQAGARRAYLEATARSPYTSAFWWNLGRMHLFFGKQGEAGAKAASYEAFRRALEASPRNPDTYDQLARVQIGFGDLAEAVVSADRAIALIPTEYTYYVVKADAVRLQGEVRGSLDVLRQGVAATDHNELRLIFARRLIETRTETEARAVLQEILRTEPENEQALELLRQIGG